MASDSNAITTWLIARLRFHCIQPPLDVQIIDIFTINALKSKVVPVLN
jgi:hypothetical protein